MADETTPEEGRDYEALVERLWADVRPRLTPEWFETLRLAIRAEGWQSDVIEIVKFAERCLTEANADDFPNDWPGFDDPRDPNEWPGPKPVTITAVGKGRAHPGLFGPGGPLSPG